MSKNNYLEVIVHLCIVVHHGRGCTSHSPEASQTQLGRVKSICDLARLASGIIVVISVFNSFLINVFSFVYGTAHAHGVLLCVRHYTHTLSDT